MNKLMRHKIINQNILNDIRKKNCLYDSYT